MGDAELGGKGCAWAPLTPAAKYEINSNDKGLNHVGFLGNPQLFDDLEKGSCDYGEVSNCCSGGVATKVGFVVSENSEGCIESLGLREKSEGLIGGMSENGSTQETVNNEVPSAVQNHSALHNQDLCGESGSDPKKDSSTPKGKTPRKRNKESTNSEKTPRKRMKMKRHRPKVFDETKPKKASTPKPLTPKPRTPKRAPRTPKRTTCGKTLKKNQVGELKDAVREEVVDDCHKTSCRRQLNFDVENQDTIVSCGMIADKPEVGTELETDKRFSSMIVYRRTFKPNECLENSRKLGPNCPRIFKKTRTRRKKASAFDKFIVFSTNIPEKEQTPAAINEVVKANGRKKRSKGKKPLRASVPAKRCGLKSVPAKRCDLKLRCMVKLTGKRSMRSTHRQDYSCFVSDLSEMKFSLDFLSKASNIRKKVATNLGASLGVEDESIPHLETLEYERIRNIETQESGEASVGMSTQESKTCEDNLGFPNSLDEDNLVGMSTQESKTCEDNLGFSNILDEDNLVSCNILDDMLYNQGENGRIPSETSLEKAVSFSDNWVVRANLESNVTPYSLVPQHEQNTSASKDDAFTEALVDFVVQKTEGLRIDDGGCNQLVVRDQSDALVLSKGKFDPLKKLRKTWAKVDLDDETVRVWNLLMEKGESDSIGQEDEDKAKYWKEQREIFEGRVDLFICRMHLVQGDRRFSPWKGSVVDSVAGVFLTQNVSDSLSSNAFMELPARFPPASTSELNGGEGTSHSEVHEIQQANISKPPSSKGEESSTLEKLTSNEPTNQAESTPGKEKGKGEEKQENPINGDEFCNAFMELPARFSPKSTSEHNGDEGTSLSEVHQIQQAKITESPSSKCEESSTMENLSSNRPNNQAESTPRKKKGKGKEKQETPINWDEVMKKAKGKEKQETPINWDELRKKASNGVSRNRPCHTMDSVNWEAVRRAPVQELAKLIAERGMNNLLAARIKEFLDRLVRDHGSIDLEWLRDVPPDQAKEYLLSITGLGLKSVECVRLLTLHHHAFPVDTNVGRILVRLGWVPLQPLPEDVQIHLLNQYPMLDTIQKYIWPRLCNRDQRILYEFHYQLITFGKVFCTKKRPNCNACPMRGECRHFASAFASARLRLEGKRGQNKAPESSGPSNQELLSYLPGINFSQSVDNSINCEPIVEMPVSPYVERDIEDFGLEDRCCSQSDDEVHVLNTCRALECDDSDDDIPTINLNSEEFTKNLLSFVDGEKDNTSRALVCLRPEAASIPTPKLKYVARLRTVHHVYELPDSHPLLAGFEKREPDDPCPYLFAIWTADENRSSSKETSARCSGETVSHQNDQIVRGTIMIPCRTANRGAFPLNGTYFQVNEVFADHESSHHPIPAPREWIWNLQRRALYCGTSTTSISRGLTLEEIQFCFRKGFICIRGYDRVRRAGKSLATRFHLCKTRQVEDG